MDINELNARIRVIEKEIASLPQGSISIKKIKGKEQPYLQWTEGGKRVSKYIKIGEREAVFADVERRKQLSEELKELRRQQLQTQEKDNTFSIEKQTGQMTFKTRVQTGKQLKNLSRTVLHFKKRDCFDILQKYLEKGAAGRVCLLYGLRRTGKTTMLLQAISSLPVNQTAYIKIMPTDDFASLDEDLRILSERNYKYIFIDEVTLLSDFIDISSIFSDIYAMMGMKIVLSGTDSLGLILSTEDELYDRAYTIHTTFIPFREYSRILGIRDIDEYIRYGGTFRVGETDFDDPELSDESISFRDDESTRRYIDTAIARNIQHSLAHYRHGTHFRHLIDLYDAGELTSAVNRIIEDMNHNFLLSVLTKDFVSNDLGISRKNLRKNPDPKKRSDALYKMDTDKVTERLRYILDIRNSNEMKVELTPDHVREIKEYLFLLDLIVNCPTETIGGETPIEHILFTQPGMRYSQAQALVFSLMKDSVFSALEYEERAMVTERILDEVRGRMMEEIVLLETSKVFGRKKQVFKLQFLTGEFDMVVTEADTPACHIYEIKHSKEVVPAQYRYLVDKEKCGQTEHRYGSIVSKTVLYRGKTQVVDGIQYQNVEEYLEGLS